MARLARWQYNVKGELRVTGGGRIIIRDLAVFHSDGTLAVYGKDPIDYFPLMVDNAVTLWTVVNETGAEISLPLLVEFRLRGDPVYGDDLDERNLVVLKDDQLRIKVIARPDAGAMP